MTGFFQSESDAIPSPGILSDFIGWSDPTSDLLTWVFLFFTSANFSSHFLFVDTNWSMIQFFDSMCSWQMPARLARFIKALQVDGYDCAEFPVRHRLVVGSEKKVELKCIHRQF
ncbi:unnamed protein product [Adineta ricciae]|uniref:Uncharacterized protein n=1 Tax=Adineta ricciae TaxID=249248 RepID=A0A816CX27_ADIRI|nr:unnamed protein product [Adineta ricciae]